MKFFSFNASSFALEASVENLLRSKGAISLDFGTSAYINSDAMPAILSELSTASRSQLSNDSEVLVAHLKMELGRFGEERNNLMKENTRLASQLCTHADEIALLKTQADLCAKTIDALKAENARLKAMSKSHPEAAPHADTSNKDAVKEAYEKLQKEIQSVKIQRAEVITSLKVLEDENEELREEVEMLKGQAKNAQLPKSG